MLYLEVKEKEHACCYKLQPAHKKKVTSQKSRVGIIIFEENSILLALADITLRKIQVKSNVELQFYIKRSTS